MDIIFIESSFNDNNPHSFMQGLRLIFISTHEPIGQRQVSMNQVNEALFRKPPAMVVGQYWALIGVDSKLD